MRRTPVRRWWPCRRQAGLARGELDWSGASWIGQGRVGLVRGELDSCGASWTGAGWVPRERCDGYAETQEIRAAGGEMPVAVGGIYGSYHHLASTDVSANVG